jgi:sialate O-acetylesterase
MTIAGRTRVELHDILVGDVWLASGQSNMGMPVKAGPEWQGGIVNEAHEIATAWFPHIRIFLAEHKIAFAPQPNIESKEGWQAVTPETIGPFSAVAHLFGRELHQRYHVPIGLIQSSWGGTTAEAWVSPGGLRAFSEFRQTIESIAHADQEAALSEHESYLKRRTGWEKQHAGEDRGLSHEQARWANSAADVSAWSTIQEPQKAPEDALKGYDGVVWFRKDIVVPETEKIQSAQIHLIVAGKSDSTYFNGEKVGESNGWETPRDYAVPPELVRAGRNVITVRITGENGYVGMFDSANPEKQYMEVNGKVISLVGTWWYQPGIELSDFPVESADAKLVSDRTQSTVLFNGMINPLTRFRIKGAIWYQGEDNSDRPVQYRKLFPALIEDWSHQWGYDFPFLYVQLAGFGPNKPEPADYQWAELREAQSLALALPQTGMATAVDIGNEQDIHPKDKQDVAHRLALAAANVVYNETIVDSGPTFKSMRIEGNKVRIKFSNLGHGLVLHDKYGYGRGFEVAGADRRFRWAGATLDEDDLIVAHPLVSMPVAVRYDWSNTPDGNLFNVDGLPALPFRTDAPPP